MEQKLKVWKSAVIGKSIDIDELYGCQSPDIVRHWARSLGAPEDTFAFQNAKDLKPVNDSFEQAWKKDIMVGDVVVISEDRIQPYGDCIVVTSVSDKTIMGVGAMPHGLDNLAMEYGYSRKRVVRVYRYQPFSRQDLSDMLCETLTTEIDTDEDGHTYHVVSYDSIQTAVDRIVELYLEKQS